VDRVLDRQLQRDGRGRAAAAAALERQPHDALLDRHELDALGHGIEELSLQPEEGYEPAFKTIWQGGASAIPVPDEALDRLEPLTAWLIRRGREVSGADKIDARRKEKI